jgi:hypothetical protein
VGVELMRAEGGPMNRWARERRTRGRVVLAIFTAIGLALWLQPERWARTPSYGILLELFNQQWWGTCYLFVAALMTGYLIRPQWRSLAVTAHTAAVVLLSVWLVAFIARYFSDSGTTIVNVVSWGAYLYLVVRSAVTIDSEAGLH